MLRSTVVVLVYLTATVCGAARLSEDAVQDQSWSLMQKTSIQMSKVAVQDEELKLGVDPSGINHAHIVCHHHGCAEVKAKLEVINSQLAAVSVKLAECSKSRKQLEKDLAMAAKERAKAEAALKKCGEERAILAADLAQCGKDRAAAEKGLAKCSAERGKLEAELKQCAEVDRPSAEKALAQCAADRGKLEAELAGIVKKLKGGAAKKVSTRRRRRNKKKSMVQLDFSESSTDVPLQGEDDEDVEEAEEAEDVSLLETRREAIQQRLAELAKDAENFAQDLAAAIAKAKKATATIASLTQQAEDLMSQIDSKDKEEAQKVILLARAEANTTKAAKFLEILEEKMNAATAEMEKSDQDMSKAQSDLAKQTTSQLQTQAILIDLVQKTQQLRHEELQLTHGNVSEKVGKVEALLKEKEAALQQKDGEGCDDLRAKVIHAKGKLATAGVALKACLNAKKDIQAKIDKVEMLRAAAQKGLDMCLETKARLKKSLDECHHRRDSARMKLKECLDRKKVLTVKIAECHEKRDEARAKLAQCLKNKKILQEKIAKASASLKRSSLMEVEQGSEDAEAGAGDEVEDALAALQAFNDQSDSFADLEAEIGEDLHNALTVLQEAGGEEQSIINQLEEAALMEITDQEKVAQLQTKLQDAFDALKAIDRNAEAARAASAAAGKAADDAQKSLSSLLQQL